MDFVWDLEKELAHYTAFWGRRHSSGMRHTPDLWNGRADEWDKDLRKNEARQARSHRRVAETVAYLQSRNLLRQEQEIIDIGCGLGRFVAAFARTAGHVTGVDLSDHMAEYGRAYAKAQGVDNVSFQTCDFKTADIDALGWRGRFDLVFASITPAISGIAELKKMMQMSRAYCFHSNFVFAREPVEQGVLENVLHVAPARHWDGRRFYAMFNLLWLWGYYPEVTYFKETGQDRIPADLSLAARITERYCPDATKEQLEQVRRYLLTLADSDGNLVYPVERWYGWMLWDVRDRTERDYSV